MIKIASYVLWGVVTMASTEFQANYLLRGNIVTFFMALGLYAVLSLVAYGIGRKCNNDLWFYFGGGLFGMLIIEWGFVGFYPGSGKSSIQVAMFTNWAAVFTVPRLFAAEVSNKTVRKQVGWVIFVYSLMAPVLVLVMPIPRGGSYAILLTCYSILLGFVLVPFLTHTSRGRKAFQVFLWACTLGAIVNILLW